MTTDDLLADAAPTHNQPEYSVSELSSALKRTVEDRFGYVRVRGEISGCKRAPSGHMYLDLKDEGAVLNAVCWKGVVSKLDMRPEDGLEVIATGKITTYPGKSAYQLVIERMEVAGAGALMALLEKRKAALLGEGLFDIARKLPLPYLPKIIGVVTSPTGAVIRDILHRLNDRFPVHVLLWPVSVQGKGAEGAIAEAIQGFQEFGGPGLPPRPDLLIVARGGGSIEDLWCFNEEAVVRAAAASTIPLISAVGHETDTTLIDYASSRRAPTPSAAAEMAVPVWRELVETLQSTTQQLQHGTLRRITFERERLAGMSRGLIHPETMLEMRTQRLDEWSERLEGGIRARLSVSSERLRHLSSLLSPSSLIRTLENKTERLQDRCLRHHQLWQAAWQRQETLLAAAGRMLEALSHTNTLRRGFAYVTSTRTGALVTSVKSGKREQELTVHFGDGNLQVSNMANSARKRKETLPPPSPSKQASLF